MLGPKVIDKETPVFGGTFPALGTAFAVVEADQGPEGPTLLRSLAELKAIFGSRTTTSATFYDFADAFFALQGRKLYVQRPLTATAKAATLTLTDSTSKPTIEVAFSTKGVGGDTYKVEVKDVEAKAEVRLLNSEGELLEANPPKETQAEIIEWWASHTAYITVKASEALEHTTNLPKEAAAAPLTGGVNPTLIDSECVAALASFPSDLGPGYVAIPGRTKEEIHTGLAEHAFTHNRAAWGDLEDNANPTSLITAKGAIPAALQSYIRFTSGSVTIPGVVPGTTRKVAGSAVACALGAQVAATGNNNQAPAGPEWAVSPYVLGFTHTYTMAQMETLVENGINPWAERQGALCLYGFVSARSREADPIYWSASAAAERMALNYEGEAIMEELQFKPLDKQMLTHIKGRLEGLIKRHIEIGALYAGSVEIGEPINTPAAEQKGEGAAQLQVQMTEQTQSSTLTIVSRSLTESIAS